MQMGSEKTQGSGESCPAPYRDFGALLRELRLTTGYALDDDTADDTDSTSSTRGSSGATVLPDPAMLAYLCVAGFDIDAATFNEIEAGRYLPREAGRFLDAIAAYLRLGKAEWVMLLKVVAREILVAEAGETFSTQVLGPDAQTSDDGAAPDEDREHDVR